MASSRKLRVQLQRQKLRMEAKAKVRAKHKAAAEIARRNKNYLLEIKQALGFDKFKFKGSKDDDDGLTPF
jgi:hypothetical protein